MGYPAGIGSATSISPDRKLYEHFDGTTWSLESAGTQVAGAVMTSTLVAGIPGTDATWAVADSQTSSSAPGVTVIQYNPGP